MGGVGEVCCVLVEVAKVGGRLIILKRGGVGEGLEAVRGVCDAGRRYGATKRTKDLESRILLTKVSHLLIGQKMGDRPSDASGRCAREKRGLG